ncbi:MAG: HNH endonuclease [Saprospiraceae bacterium]|nr:HNH endonuclease [Saprospiraceae bacterium]
MQVDHIDGNYLNNLKDNLRFLCPNCHSQTANYGSKKLNMPS